MADKFISNLITGDHVRPKSGMSGKQKMQIGVAIVVVVSLGSFLIWKFINYREESQVAHFVQDLSQGQYDQAYAMWDADDHYKMKDFLEDFGKDGYYTKGMQKPGVVNSRGRGGGVVVCVEFDRGRKEVPIRGRKEVPIRVDKDSLKLSYSPVDRCN
jgi:hypothetical protein